MSKNGIACTLMKQLTDVTQTKHCWLSEYESPVVHQSKLAIWWFQFQSSFRIEPIQRYALMEVAVIQHDNLGWIPTAEVGR